MRDLLRVTIGYVLTMTLGCTHCPKPKVCPPPTPVTVVTVSKPCMEPPNFPVPPTLVVSPDGSLKLTPEEGAALTVFLLSVSNYLAVQLERCKVP